MATKSVADFRDAAGKTDREMAKSPLLTGYARLYAGGAMAIAAGVVPWKPQQLAAALIACLKVAHQHACQNVVSLTTLRQQLRQHLQKVELGTHHARAGGSDPKVGFCRVEGGERVLTIHGKTFRGWFANRRQRVAVLRWLHDAGHLRMGERRCQPSSSSTQWAERSVRWPDGRVHRSYVFRDPFLPAPTAVARIGRQRR